jgi:hypothetical protein
VGFGLMPPHVIDVPVPSQSRHMLLMCLYQVRKVSGPCVLGLYQVRKVSGPCVLGLYQVRRVSGPCVLGLYQVRKVSGPCVLGVSIFPLSTIFLLDFGNVQRVWYILFFIRRGTSNVVYVWTSHSPQYRCLTYIHNMFLLNQDSTIDFIHR